MEYVELEKCQQELNLIAGVDSSSNEWKRYRSFPPRDVEISFEAIVRVSGKK